MGALRLVLALSVLLAHSPAGLPIVHGAGGEVAVETFFLISGFYMALILSRTYSTVGPFWANRALRIFPTYFACALLGLVLAGPADWPSSLARLPTDARALVAVSSVTVFGQDLALFFSADSGRLAFTTDFTSSAQPLYQHMLIPQAWTLSLELTFYLLAPWLARRSTAWLIGIAGTSIGIRLLLASQGLSADPWSYRFFPSELGLFVGGMLSYRVVPSLPLELARRFRIPALVTLLLVTALMSHAPSAVRPAYYGSVALLLPTLLRWSGSRLDRHLGNLSYPVYLAHVAVIGIVTRLAIVEPSAPLTLVLIAGGSLLVAELLLKGIDEPIERVRSRIRDTGMSRRPTLIRTLVTPVLIKESS